MKQRHNIALLIIYALIGVSAFGHSWNRNTFSGRQNGEEVRMYAALFCGAFWPLYVSALYWEPSK